MIGLGTWEIPVNSLFFKGVAQIIVADNNGEYDFSFSIPGQKLPDFEISNIKTEGNSLSADATCDMLKGKNIHADVTFDGDRCTGFVKGPMGVTIKINGKRVG
ncbi:MAG: hypothetical protein IJU45_07400 [Clostridia bacterium]|nr:hypothetical protein [Clostridia bacterium]